MEGNKEGDEQKSEEWDEQNYLLFSCSILEKAT